MVSTVHAGSQRVDADFAAEVLADLYAYPPKRRWLAYLLWTTLGWFGAHRLYLDRPATGLLMLFSLGGGLVWWVVDGFLIGSMVEQYNREQRLREQTGMAPRALDFMPPLEKDVLAKPPDWTYHWRAASSLRRALRFSGDLLVLTVVGTLLGTVARRFDVWEAIVAILVLVAVSGAGASLNRFAHTPVVRGLIRWSHKLRLFYYYNAPRSPLGLLFRPIVGPFLAPLRRRDRAEVSLYLQLGAVFTALFVILDFGPDVIGPVLSGQGLPFFRIFGLWLSEATVTFIVIFGFATPIGAVLNLYLLMMRTHHVPRALCAFVTTMILYGLVR